MLTITQAGPDARKEWEALWHENCAHFAAQDMTPEVVGGLWARITDPSSAMRAWLARREGTAVGLAHTILHPHTFSLRLVCYLEDLWVTPAARGAGVATALIDHLAIVGRHEDWRRLYWETDAGNLQAQRLYDRIASRRGSLVYQLDLARPQADASSTSAP